MKSKSKSTPAKTNFHFKDEFFEELLNGIPSEDFEYDDKKNSSVVLSPDNKVRFKHVVKEILSTDESKQIFINLIKNAKKREQAKFLIDLDLFFLNKDDDEDKDEDDEEIEEIGEKEKKQNTLSKILDIKKKYDKLKKLSRKKDNFFKIINTIRSSYLAISAMSVAGTLAVRNKTLREMHEYLDPFLNDHFMVFMVNVAYPSITTSILSLASDVTEKLKELIVSVYNGFNTVYKEAIKFGISFIPYVGPFLSAGAEVADTDWSDFGDDIEKSIYTVGDVGVKFVSNKIKFIWNAIKFGPKIYESIFEKDVIQNGLSGIFIMFGTFDENARKKTEISLQKSIKKINAKGDEIIKKIRSPKDSTINLTDMTKDFADIGIDLYSTSRDYVKDELDNFESNIEDIINDKSSTQDKFEFAYRLIANSYFKSVDLSPWSRAMRLIGGIVKKTSRLFDNLHKRLKESNETHEGIYYSNGKKANLEEYFDFIKSKLRAKRLKSESLVKNKKTKSPGNMSFLVSTRQVIHEKVGEYTRFRYAPYVWIAFSKDKIKKRKFTSSFYEKNGEKMILLDENETEASIYSLDDKNDTDFIRDSDGMSYEVKIIRNEKFEESINLYRPTATNSFFDYLFSYHFNKSSKDFLKEIKFLNTNNVDFKIEEEKAEIYDYLNFDDDFFKDMRLSSDFDGVSGFYNIILMSETYSHQAKSHIYSKMCEMLSVIDEDKSLNEKYNTFISRFSINYEANQL